MRRWNGWGDETVVYPFPDSAKRYLEGLIGPGILHKDATLDEALGKVPKTDLPDYPLVQTDAVQRLLHARGQSLPDWVALRSGEIDSFPDGVAYPENREDIQALLKLAGKELIHLIPYGGGTSVVGHINPLPDGGPVVTLDMSRIDKLENIDEKSRLATFGAGVRGPLLESQLQSLGFTLGHFPQSFELSTLGGWLATRSCGQQSYYYGRIEDLFAGGIVETPSGTLDLPNLPASAAGPDLRQLVLGSEGRLGVITQATVRIQPVPESEALYGVILHDWESGVEALRRLAQERAPISMARLSNSLETETTLRLSGKDKLAGWAKRGMGALGYGEERCLLILGTTGSFRAVRQALRQAKSILRANGGLFTGQTIGKLWRKSRFLTPYLRNSLWEAGYAIDTLETSLPWSQILPASKEILAKMGEALEPLDERAVVFSHLSHIYPDGASIYTTYLFRRSRDPHETLERWRRLKSAATQVILVEHGTISHQHGVGLDHAPYLEAEKSKLGITLMQEISRSLDPSGLMNPGKGW